jgi:hypothetical protein
MRGRKVMRALHRGQWRNVVRSSLSTRLNAKVIRRFVSHTGDGMALVFYNSPEAPVKCALETSRAPGVPEDFVPVRVFQWREDADMAHWRFLGWMKKECD